MTTDAGQPNFPNLETRAVNEDGTWAAPWYAFIRALWVRGGQSRLAPVNAAYIEQSPVAAGAPLEVRKAADGSLIGVIALQDEPGGPEVAVVVGASPQTYLAPGSGTLIVTSGKIELSRNGGAIWHTAGLQGGAIPLLKDDQLRVSWFGGAPEITWLPATPAA